MSATQPAPQPPGFLLRDASDINHLLVHLLTHWRIPRVEVRVGKLPSRYSQRAQDRFVRLSLACNCLLGEILGVATLLIGGRAAWVSAWSWRELGLLAIAALGAALIGKAMELAWTRMRLLLVLRALRHALAEALAGRIVETPANIAAAEPYRHAWNRVDGDEAYADPIQRPWPPAGSGRPAVLLRDVGDIHRIVRDLLTHWTLPRIEIQVNVLPRLAVQRAQDRFARLTAGHNYLLAGVLGTSGLLIGFAWIVWPSNQVLLWTMRPPRDDVLLVLGITLGAALTGCAGEILWIRLRLLRVLLGLRAALKTRRQAS